jgi:hypothetical protein
LAGERGRESRSTIFKSKSSLKTSAIALHAEVVPLRRTRRLLEFTRRPVPEAGAARANYNSNLLCSNSLSSAGGGIELGKDLVSGGLA